MNTSYSLDAYKAHDLNISMKTSSGDMIKMDFSNEQSLSMRHNKDQNSSKDSLLFSSMQSFNFSMDTNGIDAKDQKEIKEFMKTAQPFIDDFLKELDSGSQKSSVSKIAKQVSDIFRPMSESNTQNPNSNLSSSNENLRNLAKNSIVQMFDNSAKGLKNLDKIFADAQKFLEKILHEFDKINKDIYA